MTFSCTGQQYLNDFFFLCVFFSLQEMLAIMKSIYDMMGRYTYPCVRDEAPYEHVDKFFQVLNAHWFFLKKAHCSWCFAIQFVLKLWSILKMLKTCFFFFSFEWTFSSRKWIKIRTVWWPLRSSSRLVRRWIGLVPLTDFIRSDGVILTWD